MSLSAFLWTGGLNDPIHLIIDLQVVIGLGKVNGDFVRVAGLLERWLGETRPHCNCERNCSGDDKLLHVTSTVIEFYYLDCKVR